MERRLNAGLEHVGKDLSTGVGTLRAEREAAGQSYTADPAVPKVKPKPKAASAQQYHAPKTEAVPAPRPPVTADPYQRKLERDEQALHGNDPNAQRTKRYMQQTYLDPSTGVGTVRAERDGITLPKDPVGTGDFRTAEREQQAREDLKAREKELQNKRDRLWQEQNLYRKQEELYRKSSQPEKAAAARESAAALSKQLQQTQTELAAAKRERSLVAPTAGEWAGANIVAGLANASGGIYETLDWLLPTEYLGADNPIDRYFDWMSEERQYANEYATLLNAARGGAWNQGGELVQGAVGMLPTAILAYLSGPGAASTKLSEVMKNPVYWNHFVSSFGNEYAAAKADGASEWQAQYKAVTAALTNAAIDMGGVERYGQEGGDLSRWVRSVFEEGGESVLQDVVTNAGEKVYDYDKPWFTAEEDGTGEGVFDPYRSAGVLSEALGHAAVIGGAQWFAARTGDADGSRAMAELKKLGDVSQYYMLKKYLGELAPKTLEAFRYIKYNDDKEWRKLTGAYSILERYSVEGALKPSAKEILKFDAETFGTKQKGFNYEQAHGEERRKIKNLRTQGNAGMMKVGDKWYFAHSRINDEYSLGADTYQGEYQLIFQPKRAKYRVKNDPDSPIDRHCCTEAKFFEYAADKLVWQLIDTPEIVIFSEKHICKSCQGVMEQFQKEFPDVKITIISGRKGYNGDAKGTKTWKGRT